MKLAYGIHGYGRGHAMRALGVLPQLAQRHELLLLAGGDAFRALTPQYPVVNIPTLKYHYRRRAKLSTYLNLRRNLPAVLDFRWQGPTHDLVAGLLAEFEPAVVMSDSEPFTFWAARRLHLPTISFDHFGLLVYCRPEMSRWDQFLTWRDGIAYRMLYGKPDRIIVSGFFSASFSAGRSNSSATSSVKPATAPPKPSKPSTVSPPNWPRPTGPPSSRIKRWVQLLKLRDSSRADTPNASHGVHRAWIFVLYQRLRSSGAKRTGRAETPIFLDFLTGSRCLGRPSPTMAQQGACRLTSAVFAVDSPSSVSPDGRANGGAPAYSRLHQPE